MCLSLFLVGLANDYTIQNYIIWIFSAFFATILVIKTLFLYIYLFQYYTCKQYKKSNQIKETKKENL